MNSNFRLKSLVLEISLSLFKWFNNGQPKCTEYKSQETNKRERRLNTHTHTQCARCRSENPSKGLEREMYAINLNRQLEKNRKKKYGES